MRTNGARTLTAKMRSHSSTVVSSSVPRFVRPAELTSPSRRSKRSSQARTIARQSSSLVRSAGTNTASLPSSARRARTRSPRSRLRPQITMPAAPRPAARTAIASPRPWVLPVTITTRPSSRWSANSVMRATSPTATGRRSRSERSAARPITSGARASGPVTGGVTPAPTAAANASHWRT